MKRGKKIFERKFFYDCVTKYKLFISVCSYKLRNPIIRDDFVSKFYREFNNFEVHFEDFATKYFKFLNVRTVRRYKMYARCTREQSKILVNEHYLATRYVYSCCLDLFTFTRFRGKNYSRSK